MRSNAHRFRVSVILDSYLQDSYLQPTMTHYPFINVQCAAQSSVVSAGLGIRRRRSGGSKRSIVSSTVIIP